MNKNWRNCAVCRFMRGFAFSAIGGGIAGYTALGLGMERNDAIIAAFFGSLAAVMFFTRKPDQKK